MAHPGNIRLTLSRALIGRYHLNQASHWPPPGKCPVSHPLTETASSDVWLMTKLLQEELTKLIWNLNHWKNIWKLLSGMVVIWEQWVAVGAEWWQISRLWSWESWRGWEIRRNLEQIVVRQSKWVEHGFVLQMPGTLKVTHLKRNWIILRF